jgi:hypothetical protein
VPLLLALLSLLSGCSGMLDLPDQPQVSMQSTAPLQTEPGHRRGEAADRHPPGSWSRVNEPAMSAEPATADAGTPGEREDGGVEVRLSAR